MTVTAASTDELFAWLRLSFTPKLGGATARQLLAEFGLPEQIFAQSLLSLERYVPNEVAQALKREPDADTIERINKNLEWAQAPDQHLITIADAHYPKNLYVLHDPPLLLYAKGDLSRLQQPTIGIVGARNATITGKENAFDFARYLSQRHWCISSGLATGIDTAAHQGALAAQPPHGSTIAVLATGMDIVYPAANRELAHQIAAQGLLLSEFPLGTRARNYHFPLRNRLVAALSQGVVVVEAAQRSGSLITAKLATEIGREVFALPGSIHSPLSRGCHALIKQGAKLVESGADILDELRQPSLAPSTVAQSTPIAAKDAGAPATKGTDAATAKAAGSPATKDAGAATTEDTGGAAQTDQKATSLGTEATQSEPNQFLWVDYPWLEKMGFEALSFEQLVQISHCTVQSLGQQLTELELLGAVRRLPNGQYEQITCPQLS